MSITITENANDDQLAKILGNKICEQLSSALNTTQQASLVLSGGSTPKPLFEYLRKQEIDWQQVTITLADERCASAKDAANNGKMIREILLQDHASHANFISLYDEVIDAESAINLAEKKLQKIPLPYDVVILGMGPDGHTASIFPSGTNLDAALDLQTQANCLLVDPVTVTPLRITQTRKRLLNTKFLALHFTGPDKRDLFDSIIHNGQPNELPISAFIYQEQTPLHVFCSPTRN
jgi:6-phosphogluconolactonase